MEREETETETTRERSAADRTFKTGSHDTDRKGGIGIHNSYGNHRSRSGVFRPIRTRYVLSNDGSPKRRPGEGEEEGDPAG